MPISRHCEDPGEMIPLSLVFPALSALRSWFLPRDEPGAPRSLGLPMVVTLRATPSLAALLLALAFLPCSALTGGLLPSSHMLIHSRLTYSSGPS